MPERQASRPRSKLREVRQAMGLNAREAGAKLKLTHSFYLQLENGHRNASEEVWLDKIMPAFRNKAAELGYTLEDLMRKDRRPPRRRRRRAA